MHLGVAYGDRVKIVARHWLPGLLVLCTVATVGLLVWPAASAPPLPRPAAEHYRGPDIETHRVGPVSKFALRLASASAPTATAPAVVEAVPVLVGVAGRRAYLRSAATGEVEGISIGGSIDGWRLVSVAARTATLRGADGDRRVEMFATASPALTPGPVGVQPSPVPPTTPMAAPTGG